MSAWRWAASTMRYFERAIDERNSLLLRMATSPEYDALRGRPRFNELLRRVNLPVV
jgi:hypothetical protein